MKEFSSDAKARDTLIGAVFRSKTKTKLQYSLSGNVPPINTTITVNDDDDNTQSMRIEADATATSKKNQESGAGQKPSQP
jgi:hypothetical protein